MGILDHIHTTIKVLPPELQIFGSASTDGEDGHDQVPTEQIPEHLHAACSEDPHGPTMHSPVRTSCVILGSHPNEPVGCH